MVVQVDGKLRDKIEVAGRHRRGAPRWSWRAASENARRAIGGREVVKEIVRVPKLVNLVTALTLSRVSR